MQTMRTVNNTKDSNGVQEGLDPDYSTLSLCPQETDGWQSNVTADTTEKSLAIKTSPLQYVSGFRAFSLLIFGYFPLNNVQVVVVQCWSNKLDTLQTGTM
jgi:hypothetical protein